MIRAHLQGARILIGDHDAATRARSHTMLDAYGARIAEARSNRELLAALVEQWPFDAVISDATMRSPPCADMIALTRGAGLEVAFVVTHASDADADPLRDVVRVAAPSDADAVACELDRLLIEPHAVDLASCAFVPCAACGRPHIAELWPPMPSFCARCVERIG